MLLARQGNETVIAVTQISSRHSVVLVTLIAENKFHRVGGGEQVDQWLPVTWEEGAMGIGSYWVRDIAGEEDAKGQVYNMTKNIDNMPF